MRFPATSALLCLLPLLFTPGCGAKKEEDNGGDHIPDDKVYAVAAVPAGADELALARQETNARFLRRFVVASARYEICLDPAAFDDAALADLQAMLQARAGGANSFGLEAAVNRALATVDRYQAGSATASGRIEIVLARPGAGGCNLLVATAKPAAFPFAHDDFKAVDHALFYTNQLRTAAGAVNGAPVAYLAESLAGADRLVAAQYLIGAYLGLGESKLPGSNLSAATVASTSGRAYFLDDGAGHARFDDDAQALYGFALIYRKVLGAADLASLQHFGDQLWPADAAQDPLLTLPSGTAPRFIDRFGSAAINGARVVGEEVAVCVQNSSGIAADDTRWAAYLAFAAPDAPGTLFGILHAREPAFTAKAVLATDACDLVVALRNTAQYPFSSSTVNGLYAREGSLKDAAGAATTLPVIYLNAAGLELDPAAEASSAKPLRLVLEHEMAHFLGFKHSPSTHSLLAPAGYNTGWDLAGGDDKLFDAYLAAWTSAHK